LHINRRIADLAGGKRYLAARSTKAIADLRPTADYRMSQAAKT
jgi:hypothetical protein